MPLAVQRDGLPDRTLGAVDVTPTRVRTPHAWLRPTHMKGAKFPSRSATDGPADPTKRTRSMREESAVPVDAAWFEEAVLALLPDLLSTGRRLTRNQADAEDLAAETVARAWTALGTLRDRASFRGWVFRILTNLYITSVRSRARTPDEEPLPDEEAAFSLFERLHQPLLLWWSNPEQEFLDKLVREDFERALDALPDAFRLVVVMADVGGFAYEEIAHELGIPLGTVRSRLSRGRALLQKALWTHACDAGLRTPPPEGPTR